MSGITGLDGALQILDSNQVLDAREKRFFKASAESESLSTAIAVLSEGAKEPGEAALDVSEKLYFNRLLKAQVFQPGVESEATENPGEAALDPREKLYFNTMLHNEIFSSDAADAADSAEAVLDSQERRYFKLLSQYGSQNQPQTGEGLDLKL